MGFNKRYISEDSIRLIAASGDFEKFYKYFKSPDVIILNDNFSSKISKQIEKCAIINKDKIIEIMNECNEQKTK